MNLGDRVHPQISTIYLIFKYFVATPCGAVALNLPISSARYGPGLKYAPPNGNYLVSTTANSLEGREVRMQFGRSRGKGVHNYLFKAPFSMFEKQFSKNWTQIAQ